MVLVRFRWLRDGASVGSVIRRGLRQSRGVRLGRRARVISRVMVVRGREVSVVRSAMEMRR